MYHLIDGKKIADDIIDTVAACIAREKLEPQLAVILVGDDPASRLYVKLKERACKKAGIVFHAYYIDADAPEEDILSTVRFLNADPDIDAMLIQLPLPPRFHQQEIIDAMDYRKDVDGFHKHNIETLLAGKKQHLLPGLALGIWKLIESTGKTSYTGDNAAIISKSEHFSQPLAAILAMHGIVSSTISPNDPDRARKTKEADILIAAIGKPHSVTADMIKKNAIVIDIGINTLNGKTVGDVDFDSVAPKTSFITPVPGGVGPVTVAMLLHNTLILARERKKS